MLSAAWLLTCALALQGPDPAGGPGPDPAATRPAAASTSDSPDRPLRELASGVRRDFKRLPSLETLVIAGVGTSAAMIAHVSDAEMNQWIVEKDPASYPKVGSTFGDGWTQAGAAIGTFALGLATHNPKIERVGNDLIRGQVLNAVLTGSVKLATQRTRPSGGPHSMPSGHTSAMVTTAVVLHEHFGWKVGIPAYTAAGFVGWSRLRGEHHWLSDVFMGATLGAIAGRTVTTDERRRWTLVPAIAPDRAAVYVFWLR